jgi:hypothetical protein
MRPSSRIFFAKPASLAWIVCCLCVVAFQAAAAKPCCAARIYAIHSSPRGRRSSAARKSAPQQRLPGQASPKFAAVQGLVRGANGRPVLGATVILRNVLTGQSLQKISNAQGVFRFIDVSPGTYDLNVVAAGFKDFTNPGLQLKAGDSPVCEVTLIALPSSSIAVRKFPQLPAGTTNPSEGSQPAPVSNAPPTALEKKTLGQTGQPPPQQPVPPVAEVFQPEPDRWSVAMPDWDRYGIGGEHPYVRGSKWDPFDKNKWKGDVPIIGQQTFLNFTGTSDSFFDGRRLPTPTDVSSARPGSPGFFGRGDQIFFDQTFAFSFDLFHGDTSFRPIDWRIRITPVVSLNYLDVQERGVVNVDVSKGATRLDSHLGLQEAFGEVKLHDIGPNFDFISVRAGIQAFNSDFRGFLFVEEQPGLRIFGNLDSNRWQYNVAYFNFLEKNTNSGLNSMALRNQQVIIANAYRQDFLFQGYTAQVSVHYNKDDATIHYDDNGFLVRPAPIGAVFSSGMIRPHSVHAAYVGWTGDGHIGPVNLTHAFYQAFGNDSFNAIAGKPVTINAQLAALELSYDKDWFRIKGSVFYASGSANPSSSRARGFDSIDDFPEFAGGIFSLWNRESIRLTGSGVALNPGDSLLPDLRSNKDEGQANFVNPGILLTNLGAEFDITPKLRGFANVNYLRFEHTEVLEQILFQSPIRHSIGVDSSVGVRYRPPLTENIAITAGAATLVPGQGLRDIYTGRTLFSLFTDVRFQF